MRAALDSVRDGADAMPASQVTHRLQNGIVVQCWGDEWFWPVQLEQVLTSELGVNWREQLAEFDQQPIAAASIGQVHLGKLHDGTAVAVKVHHPACAEI